MRILTLSERTSQTAIQVSNWIGFTTEAQRTLFSNSITERISYSRVFYNADRGVLYSVAHHAGVIITYTLYSWKL